MADKFLLILRVADYRLLASIAWIPLFHKIGSQIHPIVLVFRINRERLCMGILQARPIDFHPPLAIKLRSGIILSNPSAQWHIEILVQAGIPEEQWAEVVAESGFLDPQGTFVAGYGARVLEGKHYFALPSAEAQP
jgi:hypothetical protein